MIRLLVLGMTAVVALGAASPPSYGFAPTASSDTRAAVTAGREPPHGLPQILDVHWSTTKIRPNTTMEAFVTTSANVSMVSGRLKGYGLPFQQTSPGHFHIKYTIPFLPPFLLGAWKIELVAQTPDGVEITQTSNLSYAYF